MEQYAACYNRHYMLTPLPGSGLLLRGALSIALLGILIDAQLPAALVPQSVNPNPVKYRLQVQLGHGHELSQVTCAPDGRTLVSVSALDSTIRRWDIRTGRLTDILGGIGNPGHFALSPDSRRLAVLGDDQGGRTLVIASLSDLRAVQRVPLSTEKFTDWDVVAFHPSDPNLVIISSPGGLVLFDYSRRRISSTIEMPPAVRLHSASLDGSRVASGSDNEIRVWDVARKSSLTVVKTPRVRMPESAIAELAKRGVAETYARLSEIALSDDGSVLAAHMAADRLIHLWSIPEGKELPPITLFGGPLRTPIAFSPDSRKIAVADSDWVVVYDLRTMARVLSIRPYDPPNTPLIYALNFSRDGAALAYGTTIPLGGTWDRSRMVGLIDIAAGRIGRVFNGIGWWVGGLDLAENARKVICAPYDVFHSRPIWDLNALSLDSTVLAPPRSRPTPPAAIDSYATRAFFGNFVWGLNPPRVILPDSVVFGTNRNYARRVKFLNDGKSVFVAIASDSRDMELIDIASGTIIWNVSGYIKNSWVPIIAFSPDSRMAVINTDVWAVGARSRTARLQVPGTGWPIATGIVDSDRTVVALGTTNSLGGSCYLGTFSAADGSVRKVQNLPDGTYYQSAAFDPQGTRAWLGTRQGTIQEWDLQRMTLVREWSVAFTDVQNLQYSPVMNCLAMSSEDSPVVTLLRLDSGHLLNLLSVGDDWIAYTEDGYFDSSPGGAEYLNVVAGTTAYGIDQFTSRLNRPDIILGRFGLGTPAQIAYFRRQHETRLRRLGLPEESATFAPHAPTVQITAASAEGRQAQVGFSLHDDLVPVLSYQVFVNGVPQFSGRGKDANGQTAVREAIELSDGLNRVEVSCMNRDGAESFREMAQFSVEAATRPQLFFVGIGVSKYAAASLNLGFADKDAQDLAAAFGRMGAPFSKVNVRSFVNEGATREAFQAAADWLAQAGVSDTVVVFLAGHGIHDRDPNATYYFLTHEADPSRLSATSVSYETIETLMAGVRARQKLLLLDTCESGELEDDAVAGYLTTAQSRGLRARAVPRSPGRSEGDKPAPAAAAATRPYLLDRDRLIFLDLTRRTGAVVFSASRGNELSYESETYKNGYFTAGLLRSLTETAKPGGAATVTTAQLRQAVKEWVEQETGGLQHPTIDRDNVYQTIGFPLVKAERR